MRRILLTIAAVAAVLALPAAPRRGDAAETVPERAPARTPDCVYVGTPYDVIDAMLDLLPADGRTLVYDLGCGDCRMLVAAAKRFGCRCVGYDINPLRVEESVENIGKNGVSRLVEVKEQDIFALDLAEADGLLLYLLPEMNRKLIPQLKRLKPGSRIVTHDYGIAGVTPDKSLTIDSLEDGAVHHIYLYTTPLKRKNRVKL